MHAIWKIASCDFRLTMREKSTVLWIFLMPLAFMTFFGLSFGGSSGRTPKATLTVENNDDGYLSAVLISLLAGENYYIQMSDTLPEDRDPVRTLIIPENFANIAFAFSASMLLVKLEILIIHLSPTRRICNG